MNYYNSHTDRTQEKWHILYEVMQIAAITGDTLAKGYFRIEELKSLIWDIRGLFKKYPIFGWEKYIYTPGGLQL